MLRKKKKKAATYVLQTSIRVYVEFKQGSEANLTLPHHMTGGVRDNYRPCHCEELKEDVCQKQSP